MPARTLDPGHLPQLDGLRAIAVLMVVWVHWIERISILGTPMADIGVQLFFVLSGFLIGGILLRGRELAVASRGLYIRNFFIRRALRIFPLYWVAVVALFLSDTGGFRDVFLWHASYLSNILFYDQGFSGPAIHFWTLSVEEQFYLVFPFAVLFADRKLLVPVLLLGILIAPVFRGTFGNIERNWLLLPASFDSFGIGALVGVLMSQRWTRRAGMFVMCAAGFLLYGAGTLGTGLGVLKKTAVALMLGGVVWQASGGFGGVIGRILSGPILGYIGRVSYGVYVIHLFAPEIWTWLLFKAPVPGYRIAERLGCPQVLLGSRTVTLMGWTGVTILLTAISFRFLELPCNRLKKRFPYVKPGLEA